MWGWKTIYLYRLYKHHTYIKITCISKSKDVQINKNVLHDEEKMVRGFGERSYMCRKSKISSDEKSLGGRM